MSGFDDEIRAILTARADGLHAAPDLVERVVRSSRGKRVKRIKLTALAAAVTVAGTVAPAYLVLSPAAAPPAAGRAVLSQAPQPDAPDQAGIEPPTSSPSASPTGVDRNPSLGDLGDGRAFGHVRVGYLPEGLKWTKWSIDLGDKYATSWNEIDQKDDGTYSVEIYVYEGGAVAEVEGYWKDKSDAGKVTFRGGSGYIIRQWVGEDGGPGTPTLFMSLGSERRVEIMLSPSYAKKVGKEKAINRVLKKIAAGLTADD